VQAVESGEACPKSSAAELRVGAVDIWLPGMDGMERSPAFRNMSPERPSVVMISCGNIETAVKAAS
jgi:DNA-binding NtrC family response regulator